MSYGSNYCTVELMLDLRLPGRQSSQWYTDDPDLSMFAVDPLTSMEFDLLGSSGAQLALLSEPDNFAEFIELSIGTADNTRTEIRY